MAPGPASSTASSTRDSYRSFLSLASATVCAVAVGLLVGAMTVLGPLGTGASFGPLERFLYWSLLAAVAVPLSYAVTAMALYLTRSRSLLEIVAMLAAAVLFEGALCTALVVAADQAFRPEYAAGALRIYLTVTIPTGSATVVVQFVTLRRARLALAEAGTAPERAGPAGRDQATEGQAAEEEQAAERQARFHARLPRSVTRDVIYLTVRDHYLDVHTTGGSCRILMSMAQAAADLGDLGMQVHRSWWVARRHMIETVRRDGRAMLRCTGGHDVPVSRARLPAVREELNRHRYDRP